MEKEGAEVKETNKRLSFELNYLQSQWGSILFNILIIILLAPQKAAHSIKKITGIDLKFNTTILKLERPLSHSKQVIEWLQVVRSEYLNWENPIEFQVPVMQSFPKECK